MTKTKTLAFFFLAFFALCASPALAEMYKWVDEQGGVHFSDNLFDVPDKHLNQVRTYHEESNDKLGDIPLKKVPAGFVVSAMLNGFNQVNLVVDTGATSSLINISALKRAGITFSNDKSVRILTAGGEALAGWANLESLTVGGIKKGPMKVIAHEAIEGADGLLGMDFLGSYKVEILSNGPTMKLSPQ